MQVKIWEGSYKEHSAMFSIHSASKAVARVFADFCSFLVPFNVEVGVPWDRLRRKMREGIEML